MNRLEIFKNQCSKGYMRDHRFSMFYFSLSATTTDLSESQPCPLCNCDIWSKYDFKKHMEQKHVENIQHKPIFKFGKEFMNKLAERYGTSQISTNVEMDINETLSQCSTSNVEMDTENETLSQCSVVEMDIEMTPPTTRRTTIEKSDDNVSLKVRPFTFVKIYLTIN